MHGAEVSSQNDIDAAARALGSHVARLLSAQLLQEPRLARIVDRLDGRLRAASATARQQRRAQALAALRHDLAPLLQVLDPRLSRPPHEGLAALLERRQRAQAGRLEAFGQRLGQTLDTHCGELAAGLAALDTQLGSLEAQLTPPPAADPPQPAAAPPRTSPSRHPHALYAGVMLVALLMAAALAAHRLGLLPNLWPALWPPPWASRAPPTPWEQLWAQALAQPVLGCRETRGARTFGACVCPSLDPSTPAFGAQCSPSPDWPRHRVIGALEAILRVRQPQVVWVDWEPGPELSQALQNLHCTLTPAAREARETLVSAAPEDGGSALIAAGTQDAALTLLRYLQQHPTCAG